MASRLQEANRCIIPRIYPVRAFVRGGFASGWLQMHVSDLYIKPNVCAFISFIQPSTFELQIRAIAQELLDTEIIASFSSVVVSGRGQEWIAKPGTVALYQIRVVALVSDGECAA